MMSSKVSKVETGISQIGGPDTLSSTDKDPNEYRFNSSETDKRGENILVEVFLSFGCLRFA